jgi:hypothetical protein
VTEHSDAPVTAQADGQQSAGDAPQTADWGAPGGADQDAVSSAAAALERPEVMVGAAFAGGLLAALIVKRLAR